MTTIIMMTKNANGRKSSTKLLQPSWPTFLDLR